MIYDVFFSLKVKVKNSNLLSNLFSSIFTELSSQFAQNDQPVIHRGVDDKLHDLFRA